jgi:hypothetical protein
MWDKKCQEINTYIRGRMCTKAWKFIKNVRTPEKRCVHIQMLPIDKWVQYYQDLLTENRPEYEGTKNITQTDWRRKIRSKRRKSEKSSERTKQWEIMRTRSLR